eukprot:COSAG02_NODE_5989_length_3886_cov_4.600211_2_plen_68_part_00
MVRQTCDSYHTKWVICDHVYTSFQRACINPSTRLPCKRLGVAVLLGDDGLDQGQLMAAAGNRRSGGT